MTRMQVVLLAALGVSGTIIGAHSFQQAAQRGYDRGYAAAYQDMQHGYEEASKIPDDAADECLEPIRSFFLMNACVRTKVDNLYWQQNVFMPRWVAYSSKRVSGRNCLETDWASWECKKRVEP